MEQGVASPPATELPPGVSQAAPGPAPAAPAAPDGAAAAPEANVEVMEEGGETGKKWYSNPSELVVGVLIVTLTIFSIVFFREKTLQRDKDLKEHDERMASLESDINSIKNPSNN